MRRPSCRILAGPESPREWQGALPFTYHIGPGPAKVHMDRKIAYSYTTIWDVVGMVKGTTLPNEWVVPAIIAMHGSMARSIPTAAPRHTGDGSWHRRAAEERMEAEAHDRFRQLGCAKKKA